MFSLAAEDVTKTFREGRETVQVLKGASLGSVADWDLRLELRQKTLTRQFTAMETALSSLSSQSSWLGSQLASLNNDSN